MNSHPYVTARIFGRLGNQLFCYAAARRLALANNVPLRPDLRSGFPIYAFRHGRRTGEWPHVFWEALRAGPWRKDVVLRPWRWPWAWLSYLYALHEGWRGSKRIISPFIQSAGVSQRSQ